LDESSAPSSSKSEAEYVSFFSRLRSAGSLPVEGYLPGFDGATGWLNSLPLNAADLQGKVVLVDFWTYTCINWLRTLAYVRAWAERYETQGLVVVGVHTPEFPFERDVENVRQAVKDMAVGYPVALDSEYAIWQAFANRFWPAVYIADADGRIRHHQFGEGGYAECEMVIQRLLSESGRDNVPRDLASVAPAGLEAQADWASITSPETYLGYEQARGLASAGGAVLDQTHPYVAPDRLNLNHWALAGDWTIERRASVLDRVGGRILFRFHARDLHLVMGPRQRGASVPFRVLIDGQPPGEAHGLDVDKQGSGTVTQQRLYQLLRQPGTITDRTFEITFLAPGAEAYVFTFG
jgi:thiol-disulfide isomerase/thioredoxin